MKRWTPPTAQDLRIFMGKNISIVEDKEKSKLTITFAHSDPRFAAYFLALANHETDEFLRSAALTRATAYIRYLERRLAHVAVAEYRQSLAEALATYEKSRMMASSNVPFAAEKFGNIWVSPMPTEPSPFLVLVLSITVALICWAVAVLLIKPLIQSMGK